MSLLARLSVVAAALAAVACTAAPEDAAVEEGTSDLSALAKHTNPVLPVDCPDPGVLRDDDAQGPLYYLVCTTNGPNDVFRIHRSRDLVTWETTDRFVFPGAYPEIASGARHPHPWASDNFWAPEIHRMPDSAPAQARYVVYYTARHRVNHRLCIGTAAAPTAMGPYVESAEPLVCHDGFGVIDAHYFRDDDGSAYLYWKDDGNDRAPDIQSALHGRTQLQVQRLTASGLALADARGNPAPLAPTGLVDHTLDWEGDLVEAPWVVKHAGSYYLFYSSFSYCDGRYAMGVAKASSPLGPFVKHPSGAPIFTSGGGFDGPGHGSVVAGPAAGSSYFVYHAWNAGETCNQAGSARRVLVDRVTWKAIPRSAGQASAEIWPTINDGHPSHGPK